MKDKKQIQVCELCETEVFGAFCSQCGREINLKRIDGKYILSEIGSVFNFEKGILYTIRELLLRPGKNIQDFISKDRKRLVKPIVFIIISSLIYTILLQLFKFDDGYITYSFDSDSTGNSIFE